MLKHAADARLQGTYVLTNHKRKPSKQCRCLRCAADGIFAGFTSSCVDNMCMGLFLILRRLTTLCVMVAIVLQGAFRQVAAEADACAKELTQTLKQRMVTQKDEAAECIQMVRKLGEPIESLQVRVP